MDLANLSAFIAIAETGSFSGAGERLHLTATVASVMALDEDEDHLLKRLNYALAQAKSRQTHQVQRA